MHLHYYNKNGRMLIWGCIWFRQLYRVYDKRVVEVPGHLKRRKIKLNADNTELAYAA